MTTYPSNCMEVAMLDDRMLLDRTPENDVVISSRPKQVSERAAIEPRVRFPEVDWSSFRASRMIRGGHLQTIVGSYLPSSLRPAPISEHLAPTTHGDQLLIYDSRPPQWKNGDRLVLLVHGLGGSANSPYVQRVAARFYAIGLRAIRLNLRGAGAGFPHAKQLGHAGRSEDVAAALQFLAELAPESPIAAIGFSMGGNLLLKHFGEVGGPHSQTDRILAVAPPIDLMTCMKNMLYHNGWLYDRTFASALRKIAIRRERELPGAPHRELPKHVKRLLDFDDYYTAPLSGFKDAQAYYAYASSNQWIERIRLPATIVVADDDPLIPPSMFESLGNKDFVRVHVTRSGGHLGYVGRKGSDPDRRWLDWRIMEWVTGNAK